MTRQEYAELKSLAKQLSEGLRDPSLSPETRAQAQIAAAGVAGKLCSIWFPIDWPRRIFMAVLAVLGAVGWAVTGNPYWALAWIPLPMMSPRLVGEASYAMGRFRAGLEGR
jgi:hypothetical protein